MQVEKEEQGEVTMAEPAFLTAPSGRRLAYHVTPGAAPGLVFLGGFMSDMEGTKALHLESWAKARGQAFLRFDYSGHGQSEGVFEEGTIGAWAADAEAMLDALTTGRQILIGSSMGGWIALLLAKKRPERLAGLVTIAAAPDFTEDGFWAGLNDAQRADLIQHGKVELPSDYDAPYTITRRLIEEGRDNLVLRGPLHLNCAGPFSTRDGRS